jgi:hypothetical protein
MRRSASLRTNEVSQAALPFKFGVEFELQLRLKTPHEFSISTPGEDASVSVQRSFSLALMDVVAQVLSRSGMIATVHNFNNDIPIEYNRWNVVLDPSLSKKHMSNGYCKCLPTARKTCVNKFADPLEIITPVLLGDSSWPEKIDTFWSALLASFDVLLDASSGTHVHISWAHGAHSLQELRDLAKAVVF